MQHFFARSGAGMEWLVSDCGVETGRDDEVGKEFLEFLGEVASFIGQGKRECGFRFRRRNLRTHRTLVGRLAVECGDA